MDFGEFEFVVREHWVDLVVELAEHLTAKDLMNAGLSPAGCQSLADVCLEAKRRLEFVNSVKYE